MSTIFRTEWRLLVRNWGVWVVLAGSLVLAYDVGRSGTVNTLPFWVDESMFRFYLLGPLLLSIAAARRTRLDRVDELIDATPYRPVPWVLGRYLANVTLWLLFSLPAWVMVWLLFTLRGEPVAGGLLTLQWAVGAPAAVAVTTAVGFALGCLPGNGIFGYLLAMIYYFGSLFVPMLTRGKLAFLDVIAPQRYFPLNLTGFFPNSGLVLLNRLFALGLSALLLALVLGLLARRRRLPVLLSVVALVLAGSVAAGAAASSGYLLDGRERNVLAEAVGRPVPMQPDEPAGRVLLDNYDLAARVTPAIHGLAITGSFDVANPGAQPLTELALTLRANFQVDRITAPDGREIPFRRNGDSLELQLGLQPGQTVRLTATWSGTVWHWRDSVGYRYEGQALGAHVAADSIFLPATYGWYPLPGRQALAASYEHDCAGGRCQTSVYDLAPKTQPAAFALTVAGTDLSLVTNSGGRIPGLYVVGTGLPTVTYESIEMAVSPENRADAARLVGELTKRAALLDLTLAQGGRPLRVIEMPEATLYGRQYATEQWEAPGAVLLRTSDFAWLTKSESTAVNAGQLSLRWWAESNHVVIQGGLGAYMDLVASGQTPRLFRPGESQVLAAMVALEQARGRDAALGVLRELYTSGHGRVTLQEFTRVMTTAAGGDAKVLDALQKMEGELR